MDSPTSSLTSVSYLQSQLSSQASQGNQQVQENASTSELQRVLLRLKVGDFQMRWEAAKAMKNFETEAIKPLLDILQEEDTDGELLWFVARILGNLEHPVAIAALIDLLRSTSNAEVAAMAADALAQQGVAAIVPLSQLLENSATRLFAIQALAQIQHPAVIAPLLEVAQDPLPANRACAIEALSHFYDAAVPPILFTALKDCVASVRQAAVIALGIQAKQLNKHELIQQLQPLLWDINLEVCRQVIIALGRIATDEAATLLFEILRSSKTPLLLQTEAVFALARLDSVCAINYLHQFLTLPPAQQLPSFLEICQEIVVVLGRVESASAQVVATNILLTLFTSAHPLISSVKGKQSIALSLGQLGQPQALNTLIHLLADPDKRVQFHAIAALKQLAPELAYQRLQELSTQTTLNAELKSGIATALQEWNS